MARQAPTWPGMTGDIFPRPRQGSGSSGPFLDSAYRADGNRGLGRLGPHLLSPLRVDDVLGVGVLALGVHRVLFDGNVGSLGSDVEHDTFGLLADRLGPVDGVDRLAVEPAGMAEGERGFQGQLLGQVGGADPLDDRGEGRVVGRELDPLPGGLGRLGWSSSPARSSSPFDVALDVGDAADDEDGDGALPQSDRLAGRGRPGVATLLQGLLGLGRRRVVVDRPGAGGGDGVLVEGRGAGGRRGGRARPDRLRARPRQRPEQRPDGGREHAGHQPSCVHHQPSSSPSPARGAVSFAWTRRLLPVADCPVERRAAGGRPTVLRSTCPAGTRIHVSTNTCSLCSTPVSVGGVVTPPP